MPRDRRGRDEWTEEDAIVHDLLAHALQGHEVHFGGAEPAAVARAARVLARGGTGDPNPFGALADAVALLSSGLLDVRPARGAGRKRPEQALAAALGSARALLPLYDGDGSGQPRGRCFPAPGGGARVVHVYDVPASELRRIADLDGHDRAAGEALWSELLAAALAAYALSVLPPARRAEVLARWAGEPGGR